MLIFVDLDLDQNVANHSFTGIGAMVGVGGGGVGSLLALLVGGVQFAGIIGSLVGVCSLPA